MTEQRVSDEELAARELFEVDLTRIDPWTGREDPDYRLFLVIRENGVMVDAWPDHGEPEDNSFGRDWAWVPEQLQHAYQVGKDAGYAQALRDLRVADPKTSARLDERGP
jgi:hypothetical protein